MHQLDAIKTKFRDGKHAEALQECEALCRKDPANTAVKKLCATMHGLVGNYDASSRLLKEVLAANPDDGDAIFNVGVCERERRNFGEAERYYSIYTTKFPTQWEGWVNLAECRLQLGDAAGSLRSADEAIKRNASGSQCWLVRGDALHALKRHAEALQSYERANAIEASAVTLAKQGSMLNELGRHRDALARFGRAIELAPGLLPAHSGRADALNYLGRLDEAVTDYKVVLSARPDDGETLKKISVCLVNLQRGAEAIQLCREALEADPSSLTAKQGMSWLIDNIVPNWHVPMMNEFERNDAYFRGMQAARISGATCTSRSLSASTSAYSTPSRRRSCRSSGAIST